MFDRYACRHLSSVLILRTVLFSDMHLDSLLPASLHLFLSLSSLLSESSLLPSLSLSLSLSLCPLFSLSLSLCPSLSFSSLSFNYISQLVYFLTTNMNTVEFFFTVFPCLIPLIL